MFLIAFGLLIVGYVGQFFGRWIKSAVSRQREYLADASAVQFTRDNQGLGGALKKIAVFSGGSLLVADTEEINHMLFSNGRKMMLFATHPPLEKRIKRVDPGFRPEELEQLKARLMAQEVQGAREQEKARTQAVASTAAGRPGAGIFLDPASLIEQIGKPGWEQILLAASVTASIPLNVRRAAQSTEWSAAVLFYTLLLDQPEFREPQLLQIAQTMGEHVESQVRSLLEAGGKPGADQRLPLLELAFPALKRHPLEYIKKVLSVVQQMVVLDGHIEVFEYLLSRITVQHLWESQNPGAVRMSGSKSLSSYQDQAKRLLAIVAVHTHEAAQGTANSAQSAFAAGALVLGDGGLEMPVVADWPVTLDQDLPMLDRLAPAEKQKLLAALVATVMTDGKAAVKELELLRVICDLLHVPLPMLSGRRY